MTLPLKNSTYFCVHISTLLMMLMYEKSRIQQNCVSARVSEKNIADLTSALLDRGDATFSKASC